MSDLSRLAHDIINAAGAAGITLAVAESCTGGGLGQILTSVPGSSRAFLGGVIAYDNRVKTGLLGVEAAVVETYGAVSAEAAVQMAENVRALTGAGLAVSVTGIAGPGGGSAEKPVGLVYVAVSNEHEDPSVEQYEFGALGRAQVRQSAILKALESLSERIIKA